MSHRISIHSHSIMKLKYLTLPLLLGGSLFTLSCGEKKSEKVAEAADTVEDKAEEVTSKIVGAVTPAASVVLEETEVIPDISLEEVAKVTGFAQHLPSDIEAYLSIMEAGDSYDQLFKTKIGALIKEAAADSGDDLDEMEQEPEIQMLRAAIGEELFLAFGKGTGNQVANMQKLNTGMSVGTGKMMIQMLASGIEADGGIPAMMNNPLGMFGDPKDLIDLLEDASLPPLTIGLKVSDADMREQIAGMIAGQFASSLEFGVPGLEELALEKEGVQLSGISISGAQLAEMMEEVGDQVAQMIGGDDEFLRLQKAIAVRNIHLATGVLGDHILMYLGDSLDGFKLAKEFGDSLIGHKDAEFLKLYAEKDVRMMGLIEEGAMNKISEGLEIIASIAKGAQEGLAESEVFGDTRDIQTLLGEVAKVEGELLGMASHSSQGWIGFIEEGFKVESHGGSSVPRTDLETSHTFTSLDAQDDIFLYTNSVGNSEFSAKLAEYLEIATETAYLAAKQFNGLDLDDPDFQEFKQQFDVFDQIGAKDLAEIWSVITGDFNDGTGSESALIIDLKGALPKIPKAPEVILEKGIAPRIALVMPVEDRAKLETSWTRVEAAITNVIKNGHETGMLPEEVIMPGILDSEKYGLNSYFIGVPIFTKDSNPNVSLNDDLFIVSSSPTLNGDIVASLKKPQIVARKGSYLRMDFVQLQEFLVEWLKLAEENQDELFKSDFQKEDFMENLPLIRKTLAALEELDSYILHTRKIGGKVRSSYHFKMR